MMGKQLKALTELALKSFCLGDVVHPDHGSEPNGIGDIFHDVHIFGSRLVSVGVLGVVFSHA
jgi:hypothetical protein